ncbi:MAG: hypothetical protein FWH53_03365 [Leptospirales bacterium]|nr:hypothetical protein [Leptospirales bacterium]
MSTGLVFENKDGDLVIMKDGRTIVTAEWLYLIVLDLLKVSLSLPEEWPPIRQKLSKDKKLYELIIGAETENQVPREIITDEEYIQELREGEYFLKSIVDPNKLIDSLREKLISIGLTEREDFRIDYNRRFGRITIIFKSNK